MIKVNETKIVMEHFLDNTQRMLNVDMPKDRSANIVFYWQYQSDEELVTLFFLVNHFRNHGYCGKYILKMPYVPNARMDRVQSRNELFTLKYFCEMINNMHFDNVEIIDPHSNVCSALLNNVTVKTNINYVIKSLLEISNTTNIKDVVIYFPDYGAYHKYHEYFTKTIPEIIKGTFIENIKLSYVYGKKIRDWNTGKILGLDIANEDNVDLKNKIVLMVDDIVSYGGTMYYGAKRLKELDVAKIYAYATHTELSILDKENGTLIKSLEDGTVEKLFTTNSIFSGMHEKIIVFEYV